jgi:hypothetical protein
MSDLQDYAAAAIRDHAAEITSGRGYFEVPLHPSTLIGFLRETNPDGSRFLMPISEVEPPQFVIHGVPVEFVPGRGETITFKVRPPA